MMYQFQCAICREYIDIPMTLKEYSEKYLASVLRCECGGHLKRIYTPPIVWGDTVVKEQK